ncbi:S-adenosyl-L-methionine-dependent methyltransferase [Aspergillus floccosus]
MTMTKLDYPDILSTLSQAASSPTLQTDLSQEERQTLYQTCTKLSSCLETPQDRLSRSSFDFILPTILRLAINIGIFDLFNKEDGPVPELDVSEIATHTNTDQALIARIMRFLITFDMFDVTPDGRCKANTFTKSFRSGNSLYDTVILLSGLTLVVFGSLPAYFQKMGNRHPEDSKTGLFQDALDTDLHVYDWLGHRKPEKDACHQLMATSNSLNDSVWAYYLPQNWFSEKFVPGSNEITLVDVGGSSGKVLNAFLQRLPHSQARLILQDLPEVLEGQYDDALRSQNIERVNHSFFDPQPIQGASLYILSRVLHNWPDREASIILQHIQAAMNDQSTLLICDCVFPDKLGKVPPSDATSDMLMMAVFASLERSEGQFRALLQSIGLEVQRVWRDPVGDSLLAVLEVVRKKQLS